MPLIHSSKKKAIGENIAIEKHAHPDMPIKQAEAIAFSEQREARKSHEGIKNESKESHGKASPESHRARAIKR